MGGAVDGVIHEKTAALGAGKFVFNRIYRTSKYAVGRNNGLDENYGVFHWWLASYGRNSIEGGLWVNPMASGPYFYPTLHIAGVGDPYHVCSDVQMGSGMHEAYLGDKWLAMIQLSNRVLTVPGANIAFDKRQAQHEKDNGIWLGWGWTNLNLDHPWAYRFWMSFIESYDYQGPVNGYIPEYFNWVNPEKVKDGRYSKEREGWDPYGSFATTGSRPNEVISNEQYLGALRLKDDIYYVPVARMPSYKSREYVVMNVQGIEQSDMEQYSKALRDNTTTDSLIPTRFLPFTAPFRTEHARMRINEQIDGTRHRFMIKPPYSVGISTYSAYVEWPEHPTEAEAQARSELNGYLYYRKLNEKWVLDESATDELKNDPNLYTSELISAPDHIERVPLISAKYVSYKERNTKHPDFANWDVTGKKRYTTLLQSGATATYVWFKFIEQPAVKTAQQNWPDVYTNRYLTRLQTYIENLHRRVAQRSKVNPTEPVFINSRNVDDSAHFDPHLVKIDPGQLVVPPEGFEVGYVPVIISVYHPEAHSANGTGLIEAPNAKCTNATWTPTFFTDDL